MAIAAVEYSVLLTYIRRRKRQSAVSSSGHVESMATASKQDGNGMFIREKSKIVDLQFV